MITGAARGIGQAIAAYLAHAGCQLVLADIDHPTAQHATDQLPGSHTVLNADVTDPDAMNNIADAALQDHGRLDVWIDNAGLIPAGRFTDQPADLQTRCIDVNLSGVIHGSRATLAAVLPHQRGHLVNIASVCAVPQLAPSTGRGPAPSCCCPATRRWRPTSTNATATWRRRLGCTPKRPTRHPTSPSATT